MKGSDDSRCVEGEYKLGPFDKATGNQVITLVVKSILGGDPLYEITPIPRCAQLSTHGSLTFTIDWADAKKDLKTWKDGSYAYVAFGMPRLKADPPRLKGPYAIDPNNLNNTKWGIYDKITYEVELPAATFSPDVKPGWEDTYAITVYGPNGEFLGEVDPGVKVVEGP